MALRFIHYIITITFLVSFIQLNVFANEDEQSDQGEEQADAASTQPKFTSVAGEHTVLQGGTASLPCRVSDIGDSDAAVEWYRVGPASDGHGSQNDAENSDQQLFVQKHRMTSDNRFEIYETSNENEYDLHILNVGAYDSGPYECRISTTPPMVQRQILNVNVPPSVKIEPDQSPYSVEPGQKIILNCDAQGYPESLVTWTKEAGPLPDGRASSKAKGRAQLFFDNVSGVHSGIYKCVADNGVGEPASAKIMVDVISKDAPRNPPTVQTSQKFIAVNEGQNVSIACNYTANPLPQVHWFFENFPVNTQTQHNRDRVFIRADQQSHHHEWFTTTLTITNIQQSDFGGYFCRVSNNLGTGESAIDVSGKPGPPYLFTAAVYGDRIDLNWHVESASDITAYKLFYRKPNEDFSLSVDVPGSVSRRVKDNEWVATYSWRYDSTPTPLLKPDTEYQLAIQGINDYGEGSLPRPLLEVRTPAKFDIDERFMKATDTDWKKKEEKQVSHGPVKAGNGAYGLHRLSFLASFGCVIVAYVFSSFE